MSRIVVINHVSLDGVMQASGRPDEDTRGGFEHGGWAAANTDEVIGRVQGERMMRSSGLLFGRRTYEDLLSYWNRQPDSPFAPALNAAKKYVASTTLAEPLPWPNSTLLKGDTPEAVASLKAQPGEDIAVMGSSALIHTLLPHNLIDEFLLMVHPLVLGSGLRLFPERVPFRPLRLIDSVTATTGVIVATYQPASQERTQVSRT